MIEEPEKLQLKCGFSTIHPGFQCSLMKQYPNDHSVVFLKQCRKEIGPRIRRLNLPSCQQDITTEWHLIAYRAGIFDLVSEALDTTICPAHRYKLGLCWTRSRKCQHPLHKPSSKRRQRKESAINAVMSKEVSHKWNVLVPVGSGKSRRQGLHVAWSHDDLHVEITISSIPALNVV